MGRDIPFDKNLKCDICGKLGAFDFMGDYFCLKCTAGCRKCSILIFTENGDVCKDCKEEE